MRKYLVILAMAAFAALALVGPAAAGEGDAAVNWPGYNWMPEKSTITGVVERTDAGLAIRSGGTEYLVAGKDLSTFLGTKVAATGAVSEHGGKKTISVTSARTCEYC